MHFVHEASAAGHLHLHKIDSRLNAADILTRPPRLRVSLLTSADGSIMGYLFLCLSACVTVSQEVMAVCQ